MLFLHVLRQSFADLVLAGNPQQFLRRGVDHHDLALGVDDDQPLGDTADDRLGLFLFADDLLVFLPGDLFVFGLAADDRLVFLAQLLLVLLYFLVEFFGKNAGDETANLARTLRRPGALADFFIDNFLQTFTGGKVRIGTFDFGRRRLRADLSGEMVEAYQQQRNRDADDAGQNINPH